MKKNPKHSGRRCHLYGIGAAMLLAVLGSSTANASSSQQCASRLVVELTPSVSDPQDPQFLSSLVKQYPGYKLRWVRSESSSRIVLDLTGPGSDFGCWDVIEAMRDDGRVLSIQSDLEQLETISITAEPPSSEATHDVRISRGGIGALYTAGHDPAQAWRILAPVLPGDRAGVYADLSRRCRITLYTTGESHPCT